MIASLSKDWAIWILFSSTVRTAFPKHPDSTPSHTATPWFVPFASAVQGSKVVQTASSNALSSGGDLLSGKVALLLNWFLWEKKEVNWCSNFSNTLQFWERKDCFDVSYLLYWLGLRRLGSRIRSCVGLLVAIYHCPVAIVFLFIPYFIALFLEW